MQRRVRHDKFEGNSKGEKVKFFVKNISLSKPISVIGFWARLG